MIKLHSDFKAENASVLTAERQLGICGGIRLSVAIGDYFNGSLARESWKSYLSSLCRQLEEISFLCMGVGGSAHWVP